jgi:hypothetical protein
MKKNYGREIRRIIANYSLRKNATGYNITSNPIILKIIRDLINLNWIDCKYFDGRFLFVSPSDSLKVVIKTGETENKISTILAIKKNLILNMHNRNFKFISPEIIVT